MFNRTVEGRLSDILVLLLKIEGKLNIMANELDTFRAAVAHAEGAEASAIVLIQGLVQKLNDMASAPAGIDPAAVAALAAELDAATSPLATAIAADAPAAPATPVTTAVGV